MGRVRAVPGGALLFALLVAALAGAPAHAEVEAKLREALGARSPKVRIVAIAAVAATGDPQARIILETMLDDEEAAVRAAVIAGLGQLEDPTALTAIERMIGDPDPTVQEILGRVLPALRARRVPMHIAAVEDYSKRPTSSAPKLKADTQRALQKRMKPWGVLHEDPTRAGYGAAPLAIRSVSKRSQEGNTFIDVRCELTLVEMPGKILRAVLSSTASVGVEGETDAALEEELTQEAITACAPELADEAASYIQSRRRAEARREPAQ